MDVACIPGDGQDELWVVVERTIDGGTRRFLEYLVNDRWASSATDRDDWFYVDSGLTYDSTATTTISGLDHLENEAVTILADGAAPLTCVPQVAQVDEGEGRAHAASPQGSMSVSSDRRSNSGSNSSMMACGCGHRCVSVITPNCTSPP